MLLYVWAFLGCYCICWVKSISLKIYSLKSLIIVSAGLEALMYAFFNTRQTEPILKIRLVRGYWRWVHWLRRFTRPSLIIQLIPFALNLTPIDHPAITRAASLSTSPWDCAYIASDYCPAVQPSADHTDVTHTINNAQCIYFNTKRYLNEMGDIEHMCNKDFTRF